MAKNTGKGHRTGVVSKRTQVYNEKTKKYVKRDSETGRFLSCKDTPYKNIRRESKEEKNDKKISKKK